MEERLAMMENKRIKVIWESFIENTQLRITTLENTLIIEKACIDMAKEKLKTL